MEQHIKDDMQVLRNDVKWVKYFCALNFTLTIFVLGKLVIGA